MSPEAVLTVVTVVLAVLALVPEERGLDLRLRLSGSPRAVIAASTALVLYWALLEQLHSLPLLRLLPRAIPWMSGWDGGSSSLAVLLLATGYCLWRYGRPIPLRSLGRLREAIETTIVRRRFGEALHLLEAHIGVIRDGLEGSYWQQKIRKRFLPTPAEQFVAAFKTRKPIEGPQVAAPDSADGADDSHAGTFTITLPQIPEQSWLSAKVTQWIERPQHDAQDIARSLALSQDLVRHIATNHPYLGLYLSRLPSTWVLREFTESFSVALVADPDSILFRELRRAENIDSNGVPTVDPAAQPLLAALCEDAERAEGPQLLYSYLEIGVSLLESARAEAFRRDLNRPIGDFYESGRWSSPFFASVYLYSIAAPRNAVSPTASLLNLYGLNSLSRSLLRALDPDADVDVAREWPTPIHYLLYEVVSLLVDLVTIWRKRPQDLPADKMATLDEDIPRILPAHALEVLSSVMFDLLRSPKLGARFKGYLLEVWWDAFWEKYKSPWEQTDAVLAGLARGGGFSGKGMSHREGLSEALEHVDIIVQISEGGDRVREAFSLPPRKKA